MNRNYISQGENKFQMAITSNIGNRNSYRTSIDAKILFKGFYPFIMKEFCKPTFSDVGLKELFTS